MSGAPLSWPGNFPPLVAALGRDPKKKAIPDKLTFQGVVLFLIGLLIATSAFERFRVGFGTLQIHLYLFVMAPFLVYMLTTNLGAFPTLPLWSLGVFLGMYIISTLAGASMNFNESIKTTAAMATLVFGALMVRTQTDFRAAVLGFGIAVGFLAFFSLQSSERLGANVMETGNKNAYSLYALPAMLLAGSILVQKRSSSLLTKAVLAACTFGPLMVIMMGANRSGWLGCIAIALMLMVLRGFNVRAVAVVAMLGGATYYAITNFGTTEILQYRMQQTLQGTRSDANRGNLVLYAIEIGLENPIVGVSPQYLPIELGRRLEQGSYAASHNVIGQIVGGSGLICTAGLLVFGGSLWRLKPRNRSLPISAEFKAARWVLRMMLILWVFRGLFTGEILYSPSFSLGIGLALGQCLAIERRSQAQPLSPLMRPMPAYA